MLSQPTTNVKSFDSSFCYINSDDKKTVFRHYAWQEREFALLQTYDFSPVFIKVANCDEVRI